MKCHLSFTDTAQQTTSSAITSVLEVVPGINDETAKQLEVAFKELTWNKGISIYVKCISLLLYFAVLEIRQYTDLLKNFLL